LPAHGWAWSKGNSKKPAKRAKNSSGENPSKAGRARAAREFLPPTPSFPRRQSVQIPAAQSAARVGVARPARAGRANSVQNRFELRCRFVHDKENQRIIRGIE